MAPSLLFVAALALATGADQPHLPSRMRRDHPMRARIEADWIEQDAEFAQRKTRGPVAPADQPGKRNARAITTAQDASGGCDGIKNGICGFHTASGEKDAWWQVDIGGPHRLDRVVVFNRTDNGRAGRTRNIRILVARTSGAEQFQLVYQHDGTMFYGVREGKPLVVPLRERGISARIVRLQVPGPCSFALDEVEVYGADDPSKNLALGRPADQKSVGRFSYLGTKGVTKQPPIPKLVQSELPDGGFQLAHTRLVVERTKRLVSRLQARTDAAPVEQFEARLARFEREGCDDVGQRRALYLEARWLARDIAFRNPLLTFDKLLFVKRRDPGSLFHMVHQYYGFGAKPGGGLFVLHDPFGPNPRAKNLLVDAVVQRGCMKGQPLTPGAFISPEVSFDGETILFGYTQAHGRKPEWSPRASYHIFKVAADGSGLEQLTDGRWNDFDPCFLPSGRIIFISERRGGYLRCGGSAPPWDSPTYTLHSMEPDGRDIVCLSFHETQEWHPSVGNDGMVVYTRWDYIDRDTNVAHHMWLCRPDGGDPRAYHGNYPTRRGRRPWMEMSIRAIPDSPLYVATAAAHHGHAFGSLVLIDLRPEDDGAMSQLTRLTPDTPFPEAECGRGSMRQCMQYGTPWPLSEDDFLCVFDRQGKSRGIYWIDRDGNRELLYRDPAISCLSPIPLCPRRKPPVVPDRTTQTAAARQASTEERTATLAVMNVYDGDFQWPADTEIKALRIIQVLPKTTPAANRPRIGVASMTNARAVLGTVPVESDGSAYFEAPVGKLVYFQALDERGLAVQSMRSGTYVHPGEQLTCQGCHEPKHRPPPRTSRVPLALRRAPSKIRSDVDGANPFNYPRLVQPVLDRNCVECHRKKKAIDLSGPPTRKHGWT
ncbi:discoidin domain-containing protein, partial [PVC group bacterium]|nr:discoidin domain-containing protein [PVC group bacterium]